MVGGDIGKVLEADKGVGGSLGSDHCKHGRAASQMGEHTARVSGVLCFSLLGTEMDKNIWKSRRRRGRSHHRSPALRQCDSSERYVLRASFAQFCSGIVPYSAHTCTSRQ